jgi:hypothetical protein
MGIKTTQTEPQSHHGMLKPINPMDILCYMISCEEELERKLERKAQSERNDQHENSADLQYRLM